MSRERPSGRGPEPPWLDPDREGEEEVALHLELLVEELVAEGRTPQDARREARRRFGDVDSARHASRAMTRRHNARRGRARMWGGFRHDLRQAVRRLASDRIYTLAVVATLGLGLGAVALIASLVWGVLLRALPFPGPDRLVAVWQDNRLEGRPEDLFSPANFLDLRASATTLEELGARLFFANALVLEVDGVPETVLVQRATPSFLRALRPEPVVGRLFAEEEGEPGRDAVVLLTHAFWRERYGGDPGVVGRSLTLGGRASTVVGVLPPSMRSLNPEVHFWMPLAWDPSVHFSMAADQRSVGILHLVGRLRADASVDRARSEMVALAAGLAEEHPESNTGKGVTVRGLRDELVREARPTLLAFAGALSLLLVIAAVNVTTLQMSRASVEGPAAAVRRVLGAGRLRLVRLSILESVLPAAAAAALALLAARWAVQALLALDPVALPREQEIRVDLPVAVATMALALLLAIVSGIPSAVTSLRATAKDLARARGSSGGRTAQRIRSTLVAAELALSVTLLVGAGLLIRSFGVATEEDPGFQHETLLSSYLEVPESRRGSADEVIVWYGEALQDLRRLQGVEGVGLVSRVPLQARSVLTRLAVEGRDVPEGERPDVEFRRAWPGYFELLGVPLLEGRTFDAGDSSQGEPVAVISAVAMREIFPEGDAVGQRVRWSADPAVPPARIVGVVGDVRHFGLDRQPVPELYISSSQAPSTSTNVLVRAEADPATLLAPLRSRLGALMPGRPMPEVELVAELARASISDRRFNAVVLATFAAAALALALVGTYGVFSYWVSNQRRELGIRMAMGAAPGHILRLVLGKSAATVLAGLIAGAAAAVLLARAGASLLYGVSPTDPLVFLSACTLLAAAALGASWLPARRAAAVEPVETLTSD